MKTIELLNKADSLFQRIMSWFHEKFQRTHWLQLRYEDQTTFYHQLWNF